MEKPLNLCVPQLYLLLHECAQHLWQHVLCDYTGWPCRALNTVPGTKKLSININYYFSQTSGGKFFIDSLIIV